MDLQGIAPLEILRERYGDSLVVSVDGLDSLNQILRDDPDGMFEIGGHALYRLEYEGRIKVYPDELKPYAQRQDPNLHYWLGRQVKQNVINDIVRVQAWRGEQVDENLVLKLVVADLIDGDLYLEDVTVCDLDRPISVTDQAGHFQKFQGLGALATIVERMRAYAQARNMRWLTLTAAERPLVPIFQRHGFAVDPTPAAKRMLRQQGISIPMQQAVLQR